MKIASDKLFELQSKNSMKSYYYWFYQQRDGELGSIRCSAGIAPKWRITHNIRYGDMKSIDDDLVEIKGSEIHSDASRGIIDAIFMASLK